MSKYTELTERNQKKINDYVSKYAFFAFSDDQFREGLAKFGIDPEDAGGRFYRLGNTGGYILKERSAGLRELIDNADKEKAAAIADPDTGADFAFDMFYYELNNHEFCITYDKSETIEALGYSWEDIQSNPVLRNALDDAARRILKDFDERQEEI